MDWRDGSLFAPLKEGCEQGLFTPLAVNRSLFTPLKDRGLDALAPYPKARAPDLTDRDLLAEM